MIKDKLGKEILFFDGAMGSLLQKRGLKAGELPESVNVNHRDIMIRIHSEYLAAGCNVLTTNTFGAFSFNYKNLDEVITAAAENAHAAIKDFGGSDRYIAFGMGPTGKLLKPMGDLPFEDCIDIYKASLKNAEKLGADLILFETFTDLYELKAAVTAAKETNSLPIACTMSFDANGRTMTGCGLETMVTFLEGLGVSAFGVNCGLGPDIIKKFMPDIYKYSSTPIMIQPNAGLPDIVDGETVYKLSPKDFAASMEDICRGGAWIMGGCCGTTPEHIKAMIDRCKNLTPPTITERNLTGVCSYSKTVFFSDKPVIIGGRLNPAKDGELTKAIEERDYDYIIDEATDQIADGADIIGVNLSAPVAEEQQVLKEGVEAVQEVLNVPLKLDFTKPEALEKALRIYNGKPLICPVNISNMDLILPLIAKYGGVAVCTTADSDNLPDTSAKRCEIAGRIVEAAASHGIEKKNLLMDCGPADCTGTKTFRKADEEIALETLALIKEVFEMRAILKIHDVPEPTPFDAEFLAKAVDAGLDACVVDPGSNRIRDVLGL